MFQKLVTFFLALAAAGCVATPKTTPAALRDSGRMEAVEVNRLYKAVTKSIADGARKCLDGKTVRREVVTNGYYAQSDHTYRTALISRSGKTELHLRKIMESKTTPIIGKAPAGGYYYIVVDIAPIGSNKTKVEIYRRSGYDKATAQGIKHWAEGTSTGCPDLTKDW